MPDALQDLASQHCNEKTAKLSEADVQTTLDMLPGWSLDRETIARTFKFKNFHETMAFVNAVAWIAHRENHHPDLAVGYNQCVVRFNTHSVGGISQNDFICAAKVQMLLSSD